MKNLEKVIIVSLFILVILLFLNNSINDFINKELSIKSRIGKEFSSSEISLTEYISLSETTIGVYLKNLRNANYSKAYQMLTPEYRNVISEEEYTNNMKKVDMSGYHLENIVQRTENMYIATVVTADDVSHQILLIISDDKFSIVPEPFLEFVEVGRDISKDKVKYELVGYTVNVDSCIFEVRITNNNSTDINIGTSRIKNDIDVAISTNEVNETVPANSTKDFTIEFETSLDFPTTFEIDRKEETKTRTYSFDL